MSGIDEKEESEREQKRFNRMVGGPLLPYTAALLINAYTKTDLRLFGSSLLDGIVQKGVSSRDLPPINSRTGFFATLKLDSPHVERIRILEAPIMDAYDLNEILVILGESEAPSASGDILFWSKRELYLLYTELGIRLRRTLRAAKTQLIGTVLDQQANVPHSDARNDRAQDIDSRIADLQAAFRKKEVVLFLGAGVSINSGGPSWSSLLQQLRETFLNRAKKTKRVSKAEKESLRKVLDYMQRPHSLIDAQILEHGLGTRFRRDIGKILYNKAKKPGEILEGIAEFCKTGNVRAIVTYNWDSLLEEAFDNTVDYSRITDDTYTKDDDKVSIFHVHGFLPRTGKSKTPLVFCEKEYHDISLQPYHWINHVQIEFLRECTCLFIGLSMKDPNLRRLLRIAGSRHARPKHIAFRKWKTHKDVQKLRSDLKFKLPSKQATETVFRAQVILEEFDLRELKVDTLPMIKHEDVVSHLREIASQSLM